MAFTQQDVIKQASRLLNDPFQKRWSVDDLCRYINDAVLEIVAAKPNDFDKQISLTLSPGAQQQLPDNVYAILRPVMNDPTGAALTAVSKSVLDASLPGWRDTTKVQPSAIIDHIIFDPAQERNFEVFPPAANGAKIVLAVAEIPTLPNVESSLSAAIHTVPLKDTYLNAVIDYVLARSYESDMMSGEATAQRASMHMSAFRGALGIKSQIEAATNPRVLASRGT